MHVPSELADFFTITDTFNGGGFGVGGHDMRVGGIDSDMNQRNSQRIVDAVYGDACTKQNSVDVGENGAVRQETQESETQKKDEIFLSDSSNRKGASDMISTLSENQGGAKSAGNAVPDLSSMDGVSGLNKAGSSDAYAQGLLSDNKERNSASKEADMNMDEYYGVMMVRDVRTGGISGSGTRPSDQKWTDMASLEELNAYLFKVCVRLYECVCVCVCVCTYMSPYIHAYI
jgi:hypothetical protein